MSGVDDEGVPTRALYLPATTAAVIVVDRDPEDGLARLAYCEVSNGDGLPVPKTDVARLLRDMAGALEACVESEADR